PDGQFREQKIKVQLEEPVKTPDPSPVQLIDLSMRPNGPVLSVLTAGGKLRTSSVTQRDNLLTGETVKELSGGEIALPKRRGKGPPSFLRLSGVGDNVYVAWQDGHVVRVNTQDLEEPTIMEEVDLLRDNGATLTALEFQIGKTTLLAGDS